MAKLLFRVYLPSEEMVASNIRGAGQRLCAPFRFRFVKDSDLTKNICRMQFIVE